MFGFSFPVGTRNPHKDRKTRKIQTSGDISPVPTKKKGLGLQLGLGGRFFELGVNVRVMFRGNRILNVAL